MQRYVSAVTINAPLAPVFDTVSDIENFRKAVPHIVNVEFLTDIRRGPGCRFKETRKMGKREASTVLEVTDYVENDLIRMVSRAGGTTWDSLFTVSGTDGAVELKMVMDAVPHNLIARFFNLLIKKTLQQALDADMESIKTYCENGKDGARQVRP